MIIDYVVSGPEYWVSIPSDLATACTKGKRHSELVPPPPNSRVFESKYEAVSIASAANLCVVRRIQYSSHDAIDYFLILGN